MTIRWSSAESETLHSEERYVRVIEIWERQAGRLVLVERYRASTGERLPPFVEPSAPSVPTGTCANPDTSDAATSDTLAMSPALPADGAEERRATERMDLSGAPDFADLPPTEHA